MEDSHSNLEMIASNIVQYEVDLICDLAKSVNFNLSKSEKTKLKKVYSMAKKATVCPYDVTYCAYKDCPFKDCESHIVHTKGFPVGTLVSVADYSGTCRRYIGWLVDKESKEEKDGGV